MRSYILLSFLAIITFISSKRYINNLITKYAIKYDIERNILEAIMLVESSKRPFVVGPVGAIGLMQVMPATARLLGYKKPIPFLFLPDENINLGTKFLASLLHRYSFEKAIQCYNLGVTKYRKGIRNSYYLKKFYKYYNELRYV